MTCNLTKQWLRSKPQKLTVRHIWWLALLGLFAGCTNSAPPIAAPPTAVTAEDGSADELAVQAHPRQTDFQIKLILDAVSVSSPSYPQQLFDNGFADLALQPDQQWQQSRGLDVVAELAPIQALRLRSMPFKATATIETVIGQRTVSCAGLWLDNGETPQAGIKTIEPIPQSTAEDPAENALTSTDAGDDNVLRCRLPAEVETVAGLRAVLKITSAVQTDVWVVPVAALNYDENTGASFITVTQDNGSTQQINLKVGPTDGVVRVVEGAQLDSAMVLQTDNEASQ
jgi:hypothetical protein